MKQTYKNIELIIINDGSTDKTEEIILSYSEKFKEENIKFRYIFQENQGQAEAINKGLSIFRGEFLTWPDTDDVLKPNSIEEKVEFLQKYPQYSFVRTPANIINESNNEIIGYLQPKNKNIKENLFEDLIFENDVWFAPGCYMVKTEAFLNVNPNRKIYSSQGGQNWQMLLPIAYKYKCGFLPERLYDYYVRENSHSHKIKQDLSKQLERIEVHKDILKTVLTEIGVYEQYKKRLDIKYSKKKFILAFKYEDKKILKNEYINLKKMGALNFKLKLIYVLGKIGIFRKILLTIKKGRKRI